jgi:hypothetical protein
VPWFDLPAEELTGYRTGTAEPADLDRWWSLRLDEARAVAREPALTRYEAGTYAPVEVYDTEFSGAVAAGKDISVHPFTGHEVPAAHVERQLKHLREFGAELSRR